MIGGGGDSNGGSSYSGGGGGGPISHSIYNVYVYVLPGNSLFIIIIYFFQHFSITCMPLLLVKYRAL